MPKVDTTVKNYTVQLPVYLWEFLNERALEMKYMTSTYLSTIIFRELENPLQPKDVLLSLLRERLYPQCESKELQHIIEAVDNESQQIADLMCEGTTADTSQE